MAKILLVEDDKSLREIYGVRLLAEGYDIVSAGDGEEALAMAIKDRPDLILSDVMMPKISGFDMLDILRSTTETRDVKVIMMTALSSDDQRDRGEKLGADRYLVKSQVGIEDVVRTVHEVLGDAPTTTAPSFNSTRPNTASSQTPGVEPTAAPAPVAPQAAPADLTAAPQVAEPAAPVAAVPQPQAAPEPVPAAPEPQAAPEAVPEPAPAAPAPQPELPQPTAPFSTDRPANFGSRVVAPPERTESNDQDLMSSRIEQELAQALAGVPGSEVSAAPTPEPVAAPQPDTATPLPPAPEPIDTAAAQPAPAADQAWQAPATPAPEVSSFDVPPRQPDAQPEQPETPMN